MTHKVNKVRIELDRKETDEENDTQAALMTSMLQRLSHPPEEGGVWVGWYGDHFALSSQKGFFHVPFQADSHWFNLDVFGRPVEVTHDDSAEQSDGVYRNGTPFFYLTKDRDNMYTPVVTRDADWNISYHSPGGKCVSGFIAQHRDIIDPVNGETKIK